MNASHRLLRLEIQGFKSFATRTVFEFGPGITAIVGPNGSGKSNLTDALRWVLGEQNPRILRLRRAEDAIFAGGTKKAPSGLAEVSIVLDNADGWLPLDFSEIVVTRRLHRSGDSDFFINRSRVRLRDIADLFLKAKLGQNSYAILGQGMVDMVLSLRPDERRALIEEAADVLRHRLKIDEALGQLAATKENRDRLELLVAELEPRMKQLERQARRALEHGRLARELSINLRLHFQTRFAGVNAQRLAADDAVVNATSALEASQQQLVNGEQALSALVEELDALTLERAAAQQAIRESEERNRANEKDAFDATRRLQELRERSNQLKSEIAGLASERTALQPAAERQPEAVAGLDRALARATSFDAELANSAKQVAAARRELGQLEAGRQQLRDDHEKARGLLESTQRETERARREAEQLVQRRRGAIAKLKRWATSYLDHFRLVAGLSLRLDAARREATMAGDQTRALAAATSAGEQALANRSRSIEESTQRLRLLEQQRDARRPVQDTVDALLAVLDKRSERPRLFGLLGGLLRVDEGMETAIEAALAESLNGLVLPTRSEAFAALEALHDLAQGRIDVFVLEDVPDRRPLGSPIEPGVVGIAAQFVRCDEQYRPLIDDLLTTVVVEDVATACRIAERGQESAVTLDGTVVRPGGRMSGGRGKSDGMTFRAARHLESLQIELSRLEQGRDRERQTLARLRDDLKRGRVAEQSAQDAVSVLERQLARLAQRTNDLRRELQPQRGELDWLRRSMNGISGSGDQHDQTVAGLRIALTERARELEPLTAQVSQARAGLDSELRAQRQSEANAAEARGELAALERQRTEFEKLLQSRQAAAARIAEQLASRRTLLDTNGGAIAETESMLARLQIGQTEDAQASRRLKEGMAPLEGRIAGVTQRKFDLQRAVAALQQQRTNLERALMTAQLDLESAIRHLALLEEERASADWAVGREADLDPAAETVNAAATIEQRGARIESLRHRIRNLGSVNAEAEADYRESQERHQFLSEQMADLRQTETSILEAMEELRQLAGDQFQVTFEKVNADFQRYFRLLFSGGQAHLSLTNAAAENDAGIDITAQPPGKRLQSLAMLSGGERSMTAVALLFALLETKPAPFCVLDEVDAALDESNIGRFSAALADLALQGQFLVVTHNRATVQAADQIYGVSMTEDGVSQVLSMRLSDAAYLLE